MIGFPPTSQHTVTRFPYTTLLRSPDAGLGQMLRPVVDRGGIRDAEGDVMHPARALTRDRQAGLDRDMQFGRRAAVAHFEHMQPTGPVGAGVRSEEHTSELQSLMRHSYAVFCFKNKTINKNNK